MEPTEYLEKARSNNPEIMEIYPEQEKMSRVLFESLKKGGTIQVAQGPTGMGKTLVIIAVSLALVDIGKRVLIAEPTYRHINDNIQTEYQKIMAGAPPLPIRYGLSHPRYQDLVCPAGNLECNPDKRECQALINSCRKVQDRFECDQAKIVVCVHHLLASKPSVMNEFDAILIDESHGFPNVLQSQTQKTISGVKFEKIINDAKKNPDTENIAEDLERITQRIQGRVHKGQAIPESLNEEVFETLREIASKNEENSDLQELKHFQGGQFSSKGDFHAIKYGKKFSIKDTVSVGLISATIEDPRAHVRDCKFDSLILQPVDKYDTDRFRLRFLNRPIFGLMNGPRLSKGDAENYSVFREEANAIILELVEAVNEVTLILCQNQLDAESVLAALDKHESIRSRLTVLPDDNESDLDTFENLIQAELDQGKQIIIATASSRLWEGANVTGLKFLIIDALPYRRPSLEESEPASPKQRSQSWKSMKRFMLNRVQQGIGRLVRREGEWGVAVIIDGRFYASSKIFFRELPNYIASEQIFTWVQREKLLPKVISMIKRLKSGKSGGKNTTIDSFR